jgi:4-hydroxy-3-polyprenylbenzoate decarboxylase
LIDTGTSGDLATLVKVRERALLPQLRTLNPNIRDFCLPAVGGPHAFAVVSLANASAGLVRQVAAAVWGSDVLRFTRFLAIVEADVDVHEPSQVLSAIGANVAPERDVFTFDGPAYASDQATGSAQLSRRIGIDATPKGGLQATSRAPAGEETLRLVTARWAEYGLS